MKNLGFDLKILEIAHVWALGWLCFTVIGMYPVLISASICVQSLLVASPSLLSSIAFERWIKAVVYLVIPLMYVFASGTMHLYGFRPFHYYQLREGTKAIINDRSWYPTIFCLICVTIGIIPSVAVRAWIEWKWTIIRPNHLLNSKLLYLTSVLFFIVSTWLMVAKPKLPYQLFLPQLILVQFQIFTVVTHDSV